MMRIFKVAFCVLTLAGSVILAGCGEAETKPADVDTPAAGNTAEPADDGGSETK